MLPLVLTLVSLLAQSVPASQNDELVRAAKNPYDLARFIDSHLGFDWNVLWRALGTEGDFIQPCGKLSGGQQGCSTELITVLNPDQAILLVQGDATPADIYIRFMHEKNGSWKFAGLQQAFIHNHPRRHEVDRSSGVPFLRVASQGIRGSGVDSEVEDWYDLTRPEFEPVFSFIAQGHQSRLNFGIGRKVFGYLTAGKNVIYATLEVHFSGMDSNGEHDLGMASYAFSYSRQDASKTFRLQTPPKSKITSAEFAALTDMDEGPSNEDLVRLDLHGLTAVATGKDNSAKNYLRELLNRCKDTPEVRQLKSLLR